MDVRRFESVQYAVHLRSDVGERLYLAAEKCALLQSLPLVRRVRAAFVHVVERLTEKATRATCTVVECLAKLGIEDANHRANERTRRVVLPAVASGVAHLAKTRFVEDAHLVAILVRLELEGLNEVDYLAQSVAARETAGEFAEDAANSILN